MLMEEPTLHDLARDDERDEALARLLEEGGESAEIGLALIVAQAFNQPSGDEYDHDRIEREDH